MVHNKRLRCWTAKHASHMMRFYADTTMPRSFCVFPLNKSGPLICEAIEPVRNGVAAVGLGMQQHAFGTGVVNDAKGHKTAR